HKRCYKQKVREHLKGSFLYMILPDLEKNDGMLQVAVYQPDRENFGAWYQRYILSRMTGGEKDIQELRNLTSGKTTIVSFPLEDEEELN
ncbi:MAG: hypothetical protein ACLT4A_18390, partial [Anaerobutyricum soehngenii]